MGGITDDMISPHVQGKREETRRVLSCVFFSTFKFTFPFYQKKNKKNSPFTWLLEYGDFLVATYYKIT